MPIIPLWKEKKYLKNCTNPLFSSSSSPLSSLLYRAEYGFGGSSSSSKSSFLVMVAPVEGVGPLLLTLVGGANDVPKHNFGDGLQQSNAQRAALACCIHDQQRSRTGSHTAVDRFQLHVWKSLAIKADDAVKQAHRVKLLVWVHEKTSR